MAVSVGDGWGGRLAAATGTALAGSAQALGLSSRASLIGEKFQKAGEYIVRAGGAVLEDLEGDAATLDSSLMMIREYADVAICVQAGETAATVDLIAIAEIVARAVLVGGWLDPQFEWRPAVYSEEAEEAVLAEAGFIVSARARAALTLY